MYTFADFAENTFAKLLTNCCTVYYIERVKEIPPLQIMRTIVATATTNQEANDIWLALCEQHPYVEYADINGLQVTFVYTPAAEKEAQQEQANREWMQQQAQSELKQTKKRKQPKPLELQAKADSIGLAHLEIDKNEGVITISKRKCYGGEVLFSSKSGISVSRQLTKMAWEYATACNPRVNEI